MMAVLVSALDWPWGHAIYTQDGRLHLDNTHVFSQINYLLRGTGNAPGLLMMTHPSPTQTEMPYAPLQHTAGPA